VENKERILFTLQKVIKMSKPLYVIVSEEPESFRDRGNHFLLRDKLQTIGFEVRRVTSLDELNGDSPRVIQINDLSERYDTLRECVNAKYRYRGIGRIVLTNDTNVMIKLQILQGYAIIDPDFEDVYFDLLKYATSCAGPIAAMIKIGNRLYAEET